MTNATKKSGVALGALILFGLVGATMASVDAGAASPTTPTVTAPTVTAPSVTTPTVKTPTVPTVPTATVPTCASQLKVVKAAWKKAPAGAKKDDAKTHYDSAVAANKKHDDKTCLSELDAASAALK